MSARDEEARREAPLFSAQQARAVWRVIRLASRGVYRSQLPRMAAALAYRTIFSLIPLFVIGLVVLGAFASDEQKRAAVNDMLEFSGISEIVVDPVRTQGEASPVGRLAGLAMLPDSVAASVRRVTEAPDRQAAITEELHKAGETSRAVLEEAGGAAERLDQWIAGLVDQVSSIKFGAIGIVGVLTLIYAAISMLVEVERSFNHIYRVRVGRSWTRRIAQYWTVLTLGGLSLFLTFGVSEGAKAWLRTSLGVEDGGSWLALALGFAVTVTISTALFFALYVTVPNTRVRLRPAIIGAFVAAVLWEAGKWGFTSYLSYTTIYASLYGSIALIPLFLLWVYVTWLIVLFGLQVAHMLQTFHDWAEDAGGESGPVFFDPAVTLDVAVMAAKAFARGKPLSAGEVAERGGLAPVIASRVLERLEEAGMLHRVAPEDDGLYTLARSPASIDAADVLASGGPLIGRGEGADRGGLGRLTERLERAREEAARGLSLAEIAEIERADPRPLRTTAEDRAKPLPKPSVAENGT